MQPTPPGGSPLTLTLPDEQATYDFAVDLANALDPGDVVTLSGDLGAGKSTLARALIRHLAGDATLDVPSPTFTLLQSYDLPRFTLVHVDLYRVSQPEDLIELGFDDLPQASGFALTTVAQPGFEIGRRAAELLLERLSGSTLPARQVLLPTRLVVRKSCVRGG